jgi:hypothetical protein
MRVPNAHKSIFACLLTILTCLVLTPNLHAQEPTAAPSLIRVNLIQLNAIMTERFRAFHIYQVMPSQRSGSIPWRLTSEVVFGSSWQMAVIAPL